MKLVRRQMFSHPKSGTVIRGSNTFKIKPFNATKRRLKTFSISQTGSFIEEVNR